MKTIQELAEEYISEQKPTESDEIYNILSKVVRGFANWVADSQAPQEKPSELCVKGGYFGCLCKKCIQDLKELAEKHFPEKPVCIYCKKEVNQMIEPWGYFFPSQIFHTGCKIAHTGHPIESPQPQEPVYRSAPHPSTTIEPQEPPKKIDLLPEVFTNNFGETEMMNMSSPERLKINEIVKYLNDHVSK